MKKKPLYKKWYVWFGAFVLIGAIGSCGKDEPEEVASPAVESVAESVAVEVSSEPEVMTAED